MERLLHSKFHRLRRCHSLAAILAVAFVLHAMAAVSMPVDMHPSMALMEAHDANGMPCGDCTPAHSPDCVSVCAQNAGLLSLGEVAALTLRPTSRQPAYWPFQLSLHEPFAQPPPVPPIVAGEPLALN